MNKFWFGMALMALLSITAAPSHAATITTDDGGGADTFINGNSSGFANLYNDGAASYITANTRFSTNANSSRIALLRFDTATISSTDITNATSASFSLTVAPQSLAGSTPLFDRTYRVYGLPDGDVGDAAATGGPMDTNRGWNEGTHNGDAASSNESRWYDGNNPSLKVPAWDGSSSDGPLTTKLKTGDLTNLGTFSVTTAQAGTAGTVITFSSSALLDFVQADSNNLLTLFFIQDGAEGTGENSGYYTPFYSKEGSLSAAGDLSDAPTLTLVTPEPASLMLLALGGLVLLPRRRRAGKSCPIG